MQVPATLTAARGRAGHRALQGRSTWALEVLPCLLTQNSMPFSQLGWYPTY